MKRILSLFITILLVLSLASGCKKMPAVDKNIKPGEHFSQYDKLVQLYGTPWRDALKELDIDIQDVKLDGLNMGIPLQDTYADIDFDIMLRFGGEGEYLYDVEYTATYQYPEDEVKLLRDLVKINRELISDFGKASDTSFVFNWAEKMLGEEWNRDISYWQDMQILKRLLDEEYSGYILFWNLDSVATQNIKDMGVTHGLSVHVYINQDDGTADITISY